MLKQKHPGWTVVVQDESIFIYDVKIRSVWAIKGSKPIVLSTGSHKKTAIFGSLTEDGKQLFRQYPAADSDAFLDYLKIMHKINTKMILFIDKAPWHREERVLDYLVKHKDTVEVIQFPSGFPEANPIEECWNQGKDDVLGSIFYESFTEFKQAITTYYRTKRFHLNLFKYLCH